MSISIANTLTSRLWKGEPTVVISGKFVPGLAEKQGDSSHVYLMDSLYLPNLVSTGYGTTGNTCSLQVLGRSVYGALPVDGPVYDGLPGIGLFAEYKAGVHSGNLPANPYSNNGDGPFVAPRIHFTSNVSQHFEFYKSSSGEGTAYSYASIGSLVADDVRIVLRGPLRSLDVTGIAAVAFPPDSSTLGYDISTTPWFSSSPPRYAYSGFTPAGVGWRTTSVRIYDNPMLRGNVTAGSVPVIWS